MAYLGNFKALFIGLFFIYMTAIERLVEAKKLYTKIKYPSTEDRFEERWGALCKYSAPTKATHLEEMIIDWLKFNGHQGSKIKSTGTYVDNTKIVTDVLGFRRKIGTATYIKSKATVGVADIIATIHGLKVDIEVKFSKGDRQRDTQKAYELNVKNAGGTYVIVKSFEDFLDFYDNFMQNPKVQLLASME